MNKLLDKLNEWEKSKNIHNNQSYVNKNIKDVLKTNRSLYRREISNMNMDESIVDNIEIFNNNNRDNNVSGISNYNYDNIHFNGPSHVSFYNINLNNKFPIKLAKYELLDFKFDGKWFQGFKFCDTSIVSNLSTIHVQVLFWGDFSVCILATDIAPVCCREKEYFPYTPISYFPYSNLSISEYPVSFLGCDHKHKTVNQPVSETGKTADAIYDFDQSRISEKKSAELIPNKSPWMLLNSLELDVVSCCNINQREFLESFVPYEWIKKDIDGDVDVNNEFKQSDFSTLKYWLSKRNDIIHIEVDAQQRRILQPDSCEFVTAQEMLAKYSLAVKKFIVLNELKTNIKYKYYSIWDECFNIKYFIDLRCNDSFRNIIPAFNYQCSKLSDFVDKQSRLNRQFEVEYLDKYRIISDRLMNYKINRSIDINDDLIKESSKGQGISEIDYNIDYWISLSEILTKSSDFQSRCKSLYLLDDFKNWILFFNTYTYLFPDLCQNPQKLNKTRAKKNSKKKRIGDESVDNCTTTKNANVEDLNKDNNYDPSTDLYNYIFKTFQNYTKSIFKYRLRFNVYISSTFPRESQQDLFDLKLNSLMGMLFKNVYFQPDVSDHLDKKLMPYYASTSSTSFLNRVSQLHSNISEGIMNSFDLHNLEQYSKNLGLNVTLYDYQYKALQFMLKRENEFISREFWIPLPLKCSNSEHPCIIYYSPLFKQFNLNPLPFTSGGWNMQAMGLGKTIISLALILETQSVQNTLHCYQQEYTNFDYDDVNNGSTGNNRDIKKIQANSSFENHFDKMIQELHLIYAPRTTLVITHVSIEGQWKSELETKSCRPLKILHFYGSNRTQDPLQFCKYDVVLTSYGILSSEFNAMNLKSKNEAEKHPWLYEGTLAAKYRSVLYKLFFRRIIFDECHSLRNSQTQACLAAKELQGQSKWLLSGTPICRDIMELHPQCQILNLFGFNSFLFQSIRLACDTDSSNRIWIRRFDGIVRNTEGFKNGIFAILECLSKNYMIRHTQNQKTESRARLLELPSCFFHLEFIDLSSEQRNIYDLLWTHVRARYKRFKDRGLAVSKYIECFQFLQLSRQLCSFAEINEDELKERIRSEVIQDETRFLTDLSRYAGNMVVGLNNKTLSFEKLPKASTFPYQSLDSDCPICLEVLQSPTQSECRHLFCYTCIIIFLSNSMKHSCPMCRSLIDFDKLYSPKLYEETNSNSNDKKRTLGQNGSSENVKTADTINKKAKMNNQEVIVIDDNGRQDGNGRISEITEIPNLILFDKKITKALDIIRLQLNEGNKILVFTQFPQTLSILKRVLKQNEIVYQSIEGNMCMKKRESNLFDFQSNENCSVFLLSLRAGAAGINLTCANVLVFIDPSPNFAMENQAIGRIMRLGQTKEVHVYRLLIRKSVEENIYKLTSNYNPSQYDCNNDFNNWNIQRPLPNFVQSSNARQHRMRDLETLFSNNLSNNYF